MTALIVGGILLYLLGIGVWWPVAVMLVVVVGCVYGVPYILGYIIAWLSGALEDRVPTTGLKRDTP